VGAFDGAGGPRPVSPTGFNSKRDFGLGLIKPVGTFALNFNETLRINNRNEPPYLGRVAGSAYMQ
jgi:hypothetical protein